MNAEDVRKALRRYYAVTDPDHVGGPPEWALLDEFALRPGVEKQRIDVLAVRAWGGKPKGHERHAIEIKVDRSDWRHEISRPAKRAPFEAIAHRFYFAVPVGLVGPADVPDGCGLYVVDETGRIAIGRRAPRTDTPEPLPDGAFVEAVRRASRIEQRLRNASGFTVARFVRLEAELATATDQVDRREETISKLRARFVDLAAYAAERYVFVCECGAGEIVPTLGRRHGWRHVEPLPEGVRCYYCRPSEDLVERPPAE